MTKDLSWSFFSLCYLHIPWKGLWTERLVAAWARWTICVRLCAIRACGACPFPPSLLARLPVTRYLSVLPGLNLGRATWDTSFWATSMRIFGSVFSIRVQGYSQMTIILALQYFFVYLVKRWCPVNFPPRSTTTFGIGFLASPGILQKFPERSHMNIIYK